MTVRMHQINPMPSNVNSNRNPVTETITIPQTLAVFKILGA